MARSPAGKYIWAADLLDIKPHDQMLEIGCGEGQMARLAVLKLTSGSVTAIDRSAAMIEKAAAVLSDLSPEHFHLVNSDLLSFSIPAPQFSKAFVFNLNVFWMDPAAEMDAIRTVLLPGGKFYLFHQPPPGHDLDEFEAAFRRNLEKAKFTIEEVVKSEIGAAGTLCIISHPA